MDGIPPDPRYCGPVMVLADSTIVLNTVFSTTTSELVNTITGPQYLGSEIFFNAPHCLHFPKKIRKIFRTIFRTIPGMIFAGKVFTGKFPGGFPGELSGRIPGNAPGNFPGNFPENFPENFPDFLR